ncbi:autotransporter outer membrane beta-barrel domain-containing protein [Caproicibacter fermentans]|uniref:Uncharacterized protein n=1 Tax=Caproicibacter fermentans TaxID=2576756 RepID=A0A7G8TE82_9FIRM|nr:hypothetical protein [Caproicibacter fermentans]QNK41923.1 hypothetical protein HCR03_06735 [Caproicibacter fermentans]
MKKFRGKALAALLSLALIASSLPVTLASASTKSMSGIVNKQAHDDIYLVNGGGRKIDLNDFLVNGNSDTIETNTREAVDNPKVGAISHVSGDSLVSLQLSGDNDDTATLKLKSASKSGSEVISVLYKGDYTDNDGNEYTVKARKNVTVHVYDKGQIVFGEAKDGAIDLGCGPDDFKTFAKTRNTEKRVGLFIAEPNAADDTNDDGKDALATYQPVYLTTAKDKVTLPDNFNGVAYSVEITSGSDNVHLLGVDDSLSANAFDSQTTDAALQVVVGKSLKDSSKTYDSATNLFTKDASTSNVAFTFKKIDGTGKVSTSSDDKYVLKTKVDDKVDIETALKNLTANTAAGGDGGSYGGTPGTYVIQKDNGKSRIENLKDGSGDSAKDLDVTNSVVVFPALTSSVNVDEKTNVKGIEGTVGNLNIGDARVGYVDIDSGNVELADGKVGDITTSGSTGNVTINSGNAGNIKTTDADSGNGEVKVYGGTVGDVTSDDDIDVESSDSDTKIATGTLKAPSVMVYANEAAVAAAGIVEKAADGTITVKGSDATVKAIDMDSFESTLSLGDDNDAFSGSIPAPKNATNTTINAVNSDTSATVNGDVNADTIDADTDTSITFTGKITADTIDGDGSMVMKAGSLYVTGSVSSTKLKLSDSTLAAGTTVFKAASDAVDVGDFSCYGFTLAKTAGNNVDTFKIDTLDFAGLQINKSTSSIAKGQSETFTASAYPGGTSLPAGYTIGWELDGGSSDVFAMTSSGNTATVTVNAIDSTFASENHTTLTANLYDADGYIVDTSDYGNATCDITATEVPAIVSDTTKDFTLAPGASYQFKITAPTAPVMTAGSAGVISSITNVGKSGNDYFIKITAAANANGKATGIYVNGTKLLVVTVSGSQTFKSDTTAALTVKKGCHLPVWHYHE